ncbi:unnamed protein product [Caenorhabditis auriculariae]|uniref:Uncharacterized protein n=1 Tax=Caenorhabditis auriculariae TaxID=2777116 RepID=A0A8S1HG00_9PELO|nr:unnamed protein product [Caenorhabditis auriculariae]
MNELGAVSAVVLVKSKTITKGTDYIFQKNCRSRVLPIRADYLLGSGPSATSWISIFDRKLTKQLRR